MDKVLPEVSHFRACVEKLYLEVFPEKGITSQLLQLPDGAHLGITCSPSKGLETTLELVEQLQGHHFHLVPHIAARQVRDRLQLQDVVQRLTELNVKSVFVPGGDIPTPVGNYDSSVQMLRDMAEIGHSFDDVGVAAYPEGHPKIDDDVLFTALQEKQALATYFVTQMCFDAQVFSVWLQQIRDRGITLPAWIGLPGVMDRMKLFKTSLRIGVGDSARFARKQTSLAGKLLRSAQYRPDDLLMQLGLTIEDPAMNVGGLYLFSFNQVDNTIAWRSDMLEKMSEVTSLAKTQR